MGKVFVSNTNLSKPIQENTDSTPSLSSVGGHEQASASRGLWNFRLMGLRFCFKNSILRANQLNVNMVSCPTN